LSNYFLISLNSLHRRIIYRPTHFSGAGEVLIYTYLAPEKYVYTPLKNICQNKPHLSSKALKCVGDGGSAGELTISIPLPGPSLTEFLNPPLQRSHGSAIRFAGHGDF